VESFWTGASHWAADRHTEGPAGSLSSGGRRFDWGIDASVARLLGFFIDSTLTDENIGKHETQSTILGAQTHGRPLNHDHLHCIVQYHVVLSCHAPYRDGVRGDGCPISR
jgi:hypothetical protein